MQTDLGSVYADALASSRAASAAASAAIICSHAREIRCDSEAEKPSPQIRLPLAPGEDSVNILALGANGIPAIKTLNA